MRCIPWCLVGILCFVTPASVPGQQTQSALCVPPSPRGLDAEDARPPGTRDSQAARASPHASGAHVGSTGVNPAISSSAASKSGVQSTRAEAPTGGSTCGGTASNRINRPRLVSQTLISPARIGGGSPSLIRPFVSPSPKNA